MPTLYTLIVIPNYSIPYYLPVKSTLRMSQVSRNVDLLRSILHSGKNRVYLLNNFGFADFIVAN